MQLATERWARATMALLNIWLAASAAAADSASAQHSAVAVTKKAACVLGARKSRQALQMVLLLLH